MIDPNQRVEIWLNHLIDPNRANNKDILSDKEIETFIQRDENPVAFIADPSYDQFKQNWDEIKRALEKCVKNTDIEVIRKGKIVLNTTETVAQGGFGSIHKCHLKRGGQETDRAWVAKAIFFNSFNYRVVMNEITLHAAVNNHPNVVTLRKLTFEVFKEKLQTEYGHFDGCIYLIMDECEMNLEKYCQTHYHDELYKELDEIFYDVVCVLEKIHDLKIIHRDIKPSNVFIVVSLTRRVLQVGRKPRPWTTRSRPYRRRFFNSNADF